MLSLLANLLFVIAFLAILYTLNLRYFKLPFFPLNEIIVTGINNYNTENRQLHHVTRDQIERIVHDKIAGNFFTVNLPALRQAFSSLPWVRNAKVQRNWPDGLSVFLEEHDVLAYWNDNALINTYGEIFRTTFNEKLPLFSGPRDENSFEMSRRYKRFSKALEPLEQQIAELHLSPRHAWCIRLESGTMLTLGRAQMESSLARYAAIYNQQFYKFDQLEPLAYIDLRYPNGFAVRLPEASGQTATKLTRDMNNDVKSRECN